MKSTEFVQFHLEVVLKMNEIVKKKNHDYTGASGDAFANFKVVESMGICSTEQGFLTRMMDKMMRINTFVQKGSLLVADESVEDTLCDLANYSILMLGYIKDKKEKLALEKSTLIGKPAPEFAG